MTAADDWTARPAAYAPTSNEWCAQHEWTPRDEGDGPFYVCVRCGSATRAQPRPSPATSDFIPEPDARCGCFVAATGEVCILTNDHEGEHRFASPLPAPAEGERCDAFTEDGGEWCVREEGHAGPHQTRICDRTCDTCDCIEFHDEPPATPAPRAPSAEPSDHAPGEGTP